MVSLKFTGNKTTYTAKDEADAQRFYEQSLESYMTGQTPMKMPPTKNGLTVELHFVSIKSWMRNLKN
ncbi:hypothetical protein [Vibrio owensii]|uniref:hypothetical protein n=1 Tax=Vibrio owensii TaxID=696485 RepID=UPI0038CE2854